MTELIQFFIFFVINCLKNPVDPAKEGAEAAKKGTEAAKGTVVATGAALTGALTQLNQAAKEEADKTK